jgi:hypothetical protein
LHKRGCFPLALFSIYFHYILLFLIDSNIHSLSGGIEASKGAIQGIKGLGFFRQKKKIRTGSARFINDTRLASSSEHSSPESFISSYLSSNTPQ